MSYRDEILNLPQFYATTAHPLTIGTSTISASERHVLIARFMAVSQELALNIAARADAEIAELRRDAGRYRFLANLMRGEPELMGDAYGFRWVLPDGILSERMTLRDAIDAARGGE